MLDSRHVDSRAGAFTREGSGRVDVRGLDLDADQLGGRDGLVEQAREE